MADLERKILHGVCMSQEYIAIISLGDQSNMPERHASLDAVIKDPPICAILE